MAYNNNTDLNTLTYQISRLTAADSISLIANQFEGQITFSTNFGLEDQVITHIIKSNTLPVEIFTIDTGRLFEETYHVWSKTNKKYNTSIKAYYPREVSLQQFIESNGPDAFYESKQLRNYCCFIRKTEPLQRALKGKALLVTGLRMEHLPADTLAEQFEWDEENDVIKFHPLLHWTAEDASSFIYENKIPYNVLHNKGFANIGCAPCTRAIKPGEDFSAANWWWEKKSIPESKSKVFA